MSHEEHLTSLFKYIPDVEICMSSVLLYDLFFLDSNSGGLLSTAFMLSTSFKDLR